jgi:hypothetical protein
MRIALAGPSGTPSHNDHSDIMTNTNTLRIAVCAAISLSTLALAQEQPAVRTPPASAPDYCSASKILGATVRMNPGAEARREAEKDGDIAKKPEGKIDDVIVDGHTGELKYAVVSFGGFVGIGDKTVAVPCSALTWVPAHERFELAASEDRLKALPAFDLDKARKAGMDTAAHAIEGQWQTGKVADASGTKGHPADGTLPKRDKDAKDVVKETAKDVKDATKEAAKDVKEAAEDAAAAAKAEAKALAGTPFYLVPTRFVCASEIDDHPVYAGAEKFGKISDVLIDRGERNVALVVVKRGGALGIGGTEYLMPFRSLYFCTNGDERVHCLNTDTRKLETAVLYEKPKEGIVEAEAAKRALASDTFDKSDKDRSLPPTDKR